MRSKKYYSNGSIQYGTINNREITDYVASVQPIMHHDDQIRVYNGKEIQHPDNGTVITINHVENAQKDNNGFILSSYINRVYQEKPNELTFFSGEQLTQHTKGDTFVIDNVEHAHSSLTDSMNNVIHEHYAEKNHIHEIGEIHYLDAHIKNVISNLVKEMQFTGQLKFEANTVNMCQYPKYDFEANEQVLIKLKKNTDYNRPAPEILKLSSEERSESNFKYNFDYNTFKLNPSYIKDDLSLITNKVIDFGSPRKLDNGYMSKSGVITLDDIKYINDINILD